MANRVWVLASMFLVESHLASLSLSSARPASPRWREKAESIVPLPTLTPPEGNTTFIDGTTWCVAQPGAELAAVQLALDWACEPAGGATDCSPVQFGGPCFEPDTLFSHASFVFNSYYQQNGNNDVACNFGGAAALTTLDPSYGSCKFLASGPVSGAPPLLYFPSAASALGILIYFMIN